MQKLHDGNAFRLKKNLFKSYNFSSVFSGWEIRWRSSGTKYYKNKKASINRRNITERMLINNGYDDGVAWNIPEFNSFLRKSFLV